MMRASGRNQKRLKIAIVVPGRFHAFDLTRELLRRGVEVKLFTNHPKWAVRRFGISSGHVRSFWVEVLFERFFALLNKWAMFPFPTAFFCRWFGRWSAAQIKTESWDVVHCWSGVAEETFRALEGQRVKRLLMRGSAHIRTQSKILREEEQRTGSKVDCPSNWIIEREEREYALADQICVLSRFAYDTFVEEGVPRHKLAVIPLGADLEAFCAAPETVEARCRRILSGKPLHVLTTGSLSFQKGLWDAMQIYRRLSSERFQFTWVGAPSPDAVRFLKAVQRFTDLVPSQPQGRLPQWYARADLFLFPTLQDGYGLVLAQALASALPVLATSNCAGPDLVQEGKNGWILPIRTPEAFVQRLLWCAQHRKELADMARRIPEKHRPRSWAEAAEDFESVCLSRLKDASPAG